MHQENSHDGEIGNGFSMKVVKGHRSALARQVHEAVLIANCQPKNLLNSKAEYNRCIIPRLAVMVGTKEKEDEEDTIGERETLEYEEGLRSRKREEKGGDHQKAKRRKRWKEEPKVMKEKRQAQVHLEGEIRYSKRRRIDSLRSQKTQAIRQPRISSIFQAVEKPKSVESQINQERKQPSIEMEPSVAKYLSVAQPSILKSSKTSLVSEGLKRGIGCNNDPYTFPIEVKRTDSKPKIKKLKNEALKEENFSPTRKKLLETGKMQDIRSFFEKKITKNKLEVSQKRGGINRN